LVLKVGKGVLASKKVIIEEQGIKIERKGLLLAGLQR
jgi:hypothetical protein